ncbi:hypothetical protein GCM10007385_00110 [Tateyamaria omphalii]|nr:hypothetical protein GCM10007385_00110 [Tateyamaria omphalii]
MFEAKGVRRPTELAAIAKGAREYPSLVRRTCVVPIPCSYADANGGCLAIAENPLGNK